MGRVIMGHSPALLFCDEKIGVSYDRLLVVLLCDVGAAY